jgi:lipopolysaccharide heptosyltransferase I
MTFQPDRILLIKPSSFGDIVQSLPVLAALKRAWPDAAVDWAVKSEWAELIEGHPLLHRVVLFPRDLSDVLRCGMSLWRQKYKLVIDLQGLLRSGVYAVMTGCPARAGFADSREGSSWCYTHRIRVSAGVVHAVDRYLDLVRQLGIEADKTVTFPLPESINERDWADSLCEREKLDASEKICVLHPAARWKTKRWPTERFARLADKLICEQGLRVILVGGADELGAVDEVRRQMKQEALNLGGATNLRQLAALLRRTHLLVTNDSGPMHLAAALGTPVVAIFGPTDPRRVGPYGEGHFVLRKTVDCSRCNRSRCARDGACMTAIEVDEVFDAARKAARAVREKNHLVLPAEL